VPIEDGGRLTNDFLSRLFHLSAFLYSRPKCSATSGRLLHHTISLDATDRSLDASKEALETRMSAATASIPVPYVAAERPAINPWVVAVVVTLATFMELLDTAIANVALPHIAGGLAVSYDESTWVLTSYLVSTLSCCAFPRG